MVLAFLVCCLLAFFNLNIPNHSTYYFAGLTRNLLFLGLWIRLFADGGSNPPGPPNKKGPALLVLRYYVAALSLWGDLIRAVDSAHPALQPSAKPKYLRGICRASPLRGWLWGASPKCAPHG